MSETIISMQGITKSYGKHQVLHDVNLDIQKGDIFGLIGRNGAGKTTLFKVILGLSDYKGKLTIAGSGNLSAGRRKIGFLVGSNFFGSMTARENLEYYRVMKGLKEKREIDLVLKIVGLDKAKGPYIRFSMGMKQRLGLALAFMNQPEFLLLDEPINGLDPEGIVEFRELLLRLNRERQTTIFISSHILSELSALATHFGFIEKGKVLETISGANLREKCRECLELTVDDAPRAARVLEQQLGTRDYEVLPGNQLRVYAFLDAPQTVNRTLLEQGVGLISTQQKDSNLEDYFLNLIGGRHHG